MKNNVKHVKKYTDRALFTACVVLVFILLALTLVFQKSKAPSIAKGSTEAEIDQYAYELLEPKSDVADGKSYLEAVSYYYSQVSLAKDSEQRFNLELGLASFFGHTGDPASGIDLLDSINTSDLPPDAIYYLYTTYSYLYQRKGDEDSAKSYRQRIIDEGIYDYIAKLDSEEIDPAESGEEEGPEEDEE